MNNILNTIMNVASAGVLVGLAGFVIAFAYWVSSEILSGIRANKKAKQDREAKEKEERLTRDLQEAVRLLKKSEDEKWAMVDRAAKLHDEIEDWMKRTGRAL